MSESEETLALLADRDDAASRRRLVEDFDPIAVRLALRFRGRGEPDDDLKQVARLGLVHAIDRFDPDFGVKFATFATRTIMGELKRHLRDKTWSIRVPRSIQERWLEVNRTAADLTHRQGRSPTIDEIATAIDATREEVLEAIDAGSAYTAGSLDAPIGDADEGGATRGDMIGVVDTDLELAGPWASAIGHINNLPERERTILVLRFFEDRSQSEIAEAMGISQMHVSRLLRRSLADLRTTIGIASD